MEQAISTGIGIVSEERIDEINILEATKLGMKRAIENLWWREMVETRDNVEGLDSTIIANPTIWKASGHIDQFSDLMTDCKDCKARHDLHYSDKYPS